MDKQSRASSMLPNSLKLFMRQLSLDRRWQSKVKSDTVLRTMSTSKSNRKRKVSSTKVRRRARQTRVWLGEGTIQEVALGHATKLVLRTNLVDRSKKRQLPSPTSTTTNEST